MNPLNKAPFLLILSSLLTLSHRLPAATDRVYPLNGIAAVVNERLILDSEVHEKVASAEELLRRQYTNKPAIIAQKLGEQQQEALEGMIDHELILAEAMVLGRQVSKEHLDKYIQDLIETNYYGDSNLLFKVIAATGRTMDDLREQHRQADLVAAARREKTQNLPPPTAKQIEQYYQSHQKDFWVEESVKLSLIMFNKNRTNGPAALESRKQDAAALHARLVGGADFAAEARLHSDGTQAQQGGDWGWVERGVLRKELEVVAFSLKPGELSDVLETEQAWFIMRVADRRPGSFKPMADVSGQIQKILQAKKRSAVTKQWLDNLRAKAFIRCFGGTSGMPAQPQKPVAKIDILHVGFSLFGNAQIQPLLRAKEGELLTQSTVDQDMRSLYATGNFYNIRVAAQAVEGGINLKYVVQENPMLTDIQFTGNKNISGAELIPKLRSKTGERMDERKLFRDALAIQSIYQKAGFLQAATRYTVKYDEQTGRSTVVFEITE